MKNRLFWFGIIGLFLLSLPFFLSSPFDPTRTLVLSGETMGTTYHMKVVVPESVSRKKLAAKVDDRLQAINDVFSTYIQKSEISKLNASQKGVSVGPIFQEVYQQATQLYQMSGGAFDPSIGPLLGLWGFGAQGDEVLLSPDSQDILKTLDSVGFDLFELEDRRVTKLKPAAALDFSAIAKGYGVDQMGMLFESKGITRYFIEIGGEVLAKGFRQDGSDWVVGVESPNFESLTQTLAYRVRPQGHAVATSGVYRQWRDDNGQFVTHVLDPRTGYPVPLELVSVTVIHPTCVMADGLATTLLVMGAKEGLALVESLESTEALFLVLTNLGEIEPLLSSGFSAFIVE